MFHAASWSSGWSGSEVCDAAVKETPDEVGEEVWVKAWTSPPPAADSGNKLPRESSVSLSLFCIDEARES